MDAEGITPIHRVQGASLRSPLEGADVVVEGIVTAVFPGLDGFFIQSVPGQEDDNPTTSQGLFVTGPALGEMVDRSLGPGTRLRIRGTVVERGSDEDRSLGRPTLTALEGGTVVSVIAEGVPLPDPLVVGATPDDPMAWEAFEGMRVRVEAPLTISGNSGLQRFGELVTSFEGRLFQPTERHAPGPEAQAKAARVAARTLVLDDGSTESWPERIGWIPTADGWPNDDLPLRAGTELGPVTGIIDVRRGGYLLLPVEPLEITRSAPRPSPPLLVAATPQAAGQGAATSVSGATGEGVGDGVGNRVGDGVGAGVGTGSTGEPRTGTGEVTLRVGVMNLENLFNGDGQGGGFPTPRGAQTFELYQAQQAKLVATLAALQADVFALAEVENDGEGPFTAIRQFVEALNAAGPAGDWTEVTVAEGSGTDAIRVGIVYRSSRVAPVGAPVVPDDPIFAWGSRPPLAQAFVRLDASGAPVGSPWLVVSNHLKSKAGCPEAGNPRATSGDFDLGDGQSCWNAHRVTAADAIARWLASDPAGLGDAAAPALITGDMNSYAREDPIRLLEDRGWQDAFALAGFEHPYSFVFRGQAGRLDHVLIHEARASWLRGAWIWHTNADEFTGFGYEYDPRPTVWRSSDHDPLVVELAVAGPP